MKSIFFIFLVLSFNLHAKTIVVCSTCNIKTIQKGIDISNHGDTVFVKKGIYNEDSILMDKNIHLIGGNLPTIDAQNKGYALIIEASDFTLSGFKIKNIEQSYTKDYAAVRILNSKNFTIENNILENVFFGFMIEKSKWGLIKNNKISSHAVEEASSGNGIHMWHCSNMRIERNYVSNLRDGLYLEFVDNSFISGNTSINNIRYGLHFMFSNHDEYHHNEFNSNGAGVAVMFSKFIKMHHNTFHYNWGTASYGLLLKEIYDAEIHHNLFEQNTIGINIDGCNRIKYEHNFFVRNGWALKFTGGCYANSFKFNNFLYNSFDLSYNSRLNDNTFDFNYWSEYSGYDLNKDGIGDVPYRPVKLFSYIVNQTPETLVLLRSLFVDIINFSEKVSPVFTPDDLIDSKPLMKIVND
jgi:nitrous oxidase accessory protein